MNSKNLSPRASLAAVVLFVAGVAVLPYSAQAQAPEARSQHTAVGTGTEMIVWGGLGAGGPLNTGGIYDPDTDTWTPTSTVNAPNARVNHTAVWTGTAMIVWGGSGGGALNTGGIYDPLRDAWTPTSTKNAPDARVNHTAVWTGTAMIVWGGSGSDGAFLNTGGIYHPGTETWTPTSTLNAPDARFQHTAVWTGSKMVVWGGQDSSFVLLNTGGIYDPVGDTWTPTSTLNAPDGRRLHTAIWTDGFAEMIVWGGFGSSEALNTGGIYVPFLDTWTSTSTTNAPSERSAHTAVWAGTVMIVWGGNPPGGPLLNTGGLYDPGSDMWLRDTPTLNAPDARRFHTAVWIGSQMIVWGGNAGGGGPFFNTGGLYDPVSDSWTATSI